MSMKKIILVFYGDFLKGFLNVVKMIVGDLVDCVSLYGLYFG